MIILLDVLQYVGPANMEIRKGCEGIRRIVLDLVETGVNVQSSKMSTGFNLEK